MAKLVDPFGYPVSSGGGGRLLDATQSSTNERPSWAVVAEPIHKSISYTDWKTLLSCSRRLWANYGIIKGATVQKAMHSVGRAWQPKFLGEDKEWGEKAEAWLRDEWFGVCDVRGENFDFKTDLYLSSISIDRDGEIGILLTETEDGYPQIQLIPAHRVGQRSGASTSILTEGPYKGMRQELGVIYNKAGRAIAYNILGSTPAEDQQVSARDLMVFGDPEWCDQGRFFPAYTDSINYIRDAMQSHQWEQRAQLIASSIGLMEWNESGAFDQNDPSAVLGTQGSSGTLTQQQFDGGLVRYFKSGSGGKLDMLVNARPGEVWDSFQDRVVRMSLLGMGWPYSLTWKPDGMNGTQERSEIEKARCAIRDRQDLIEPKAKRVTGYAVSKAIKLGILPEYTGPDKGGQLLWGFSMPPQFSIDHGREGAGIRADMQLGIITRREIYEKQGKVYAAERKQKLSEVEDLLNDAKQLSDKTGVPLGTCLSLLEQRTAAGFVPGGVAGTLLDDTDTLLTNETTK